MVGARHLSSWRWSDYEPILAGLANRVQHMDRESPASPHRMRRSPRRLAGPSCLVAFLLGESQTGPEINELPFVLVAVERL